MNNSLTAECVAVLEQCAALLKRLDDTIYSNVQGLPVQSGIGAHVRHCLDFYGCLLRGLPARRIDYNQRPRDPQTENSRAHALRRVAAIQAVLCDLPALDGDMPLLVRAEDAAGNDWCQSSLGREMQALLSHTVHHYALIALLLRLQGVVPEPSFGVAPSTLKHWQQVAGSRQ